MTDVILVEKRGRIEVWTMNIPSKLNCLNSAMLKRMKELFAGASKDTSVDAVVLTGAGWFSLSRCLLCSILYTVRHATPTPRPVFHSKGAIFLAVQRSMTLG
jgi:hypothetical protein